MLQKLHIQNFRCLSNFELNLKDNPLILLNNEIDTGKSTIATVLKLFQNIGCGNNRIKDLITTKDFSYYVAPSTDNPMMFEIGVILNQKYYKYKFVLGLPKKLVDDTIIIKPECCVLQEQLMVDDELIFLRELSQTTLCIHQFKEMQMGIDKNVIALPIIQLPILNIFKTWLSNIIILSPNPKLMTGEFSGDDEFNTNFKTDGSNFGECYSKLIKTNPARYQVIDNYLRTVIPNFYEIQSEPIGGNFFKVKVIFKSNDSTEIFHIDFDNLSDGEKCHFLVALILGNTKSYPTFCFWEELDNHIKQTNIIHLMASLLKEFQNQKGSQLILTSYNHDVRKHLFPE